MSPRKEYLPGRAVGSLVVAKAFTRVCRRLVGEANRLHVDEVDLSRLTKHVLGRAQLQGRVALRVIFLRVAVQLVDEAERLTDEAGRLRGEAGRLVGASQADERQAGKFVTLVLGEERADEVLGDLDEVYQRDRSQRGEAYARRRYGQSLFGLIARHVLRTTARLMLRKRA